MITFSNLEIVAMLKLSTLASHRSYAAGEHEFGAFYAESAGAPGASPGDLRHVGVSP